jgi:UDP-3-O-[3-hydroxymyristoyl] N-acetylglucosamine deacetylase
LHTGESCSVTLRRAPGPVCFERGTEQACRDELEIVRADRGVRVRSSALGLDVDLVEHLFASLAGLSVQSGIAIGVEGPELPLLDGGALELALAIRALEPPRNPPRLRVASEGRLEIDGSEYAFSPGAGVQLEIEVDFQAIGRQRASWDGSVARFFADIAPARTFGFRREAALLRARGRAAYVDPHSVLIIEDDGSVAAPAGPARPNEFARHKLLDLIGDLYLFGGPAVGKLSALRPGHAHNHAAVRQALGLGILIRA